MRPLDAIGGSDIAAIRGEDPFRTPTDVWRRIVKGESDSASSLPAELGKASEEVILTDYCQRHGVSRTKLERTREIFLSDDEPHFRGELDGYLREGNVGLDAKLVLSPASAKMWGDEGTDMMPDYVLNQQAWYAMLGDLDRAVAVAVIWGRPRELVYERTPGFEEMILDDVRRFWRDYVLKQVPPPPREVGDVLWMHSEPKADIRPATDEEAALVAEWRALKEQAKEHKAAVEAAKVKVCAAIGDSDGLWLGGNDRITWKTNKAGTRTLRG